MNKVILIGRLTKDPELRFAAGSGNGVCKFTIAVNRQFKKNEADFINCVAFGKQAETIAQYMLKGSQIALTGHIQTGSYDAQDGTKRYTTDVLVESFEFVGGGNKNQNNNTGAGFNQGGFDADMTPVDDGDMPF
ncbi:single-stranded DNA-binding protein [Clostridium baratii]|uniref:single-stranded DNA-binding protein n=1 Tax=Clostridium baratii TaxID=1561 RepID=UPI0030D523C3